MAFFLLILVAVIQGLTEFLPVSSSGHLVLIPILTDQPYQGRAIDVAAHVGTLGAVMWYLRKDLLAMLGALLPRGDSGQRHLIGSLIIATLPVIFAGYAVNSADPAFLTDPLTLALANLVFAGLLWQADRIGSLTRHLADMRFGTALLIGLAQCAALIPGASRSGVTMTAARYLGFDRLTAARFSLLLSIPAIAGAGLLKGMDIAAAGDTQLGFDAGIVAVLSFIFATLAIDWMMRLLARTGFAVFVWYRLGLGMLLLAAVLTGWI